MLVASVKFGGNWGNLTRRLTSFPKLVSDKADYRIQNLPAINGRNPEMSDESSKETVAAYHEAGHAVGAFFLGVPVDEITLDLSGSGEGSVHSPLTIKQIRESNLCWQYAVVSMLGREAERLVFGRADRNYLEVDAKNIARLYQAFFATEMSCQMFRAELRYRTAEVVGRPGFREAIEALANVVSVEKVVPGSRATEVIRLVTDTHSSR